MIPQVEIVCSTGWKPAGRRLSRYLAACLKDLRMPSASLTLLVCGDARSRALNRLHRHHDRPTDILSFPAEAGRQRPGFSGYLGDLALNAAYVRRRFPRFADRLGEEQGYLLLHGVLHLAGFHHDDPAQERRLEALQERAFARLRGLARLPLIQPCS
jgi:probable rRNA maturation factor